MNQVEANALTNIKVADFGRYIAGPAVGAILGDLGADVVRIEAIAGNDDRWLRPVISQTGSVDATTKGEGATFLQLARNKRSLALNMKSAAGKEIVSKTIMWADVIIANMPESGLKAVGLDWERIHSMNPKAILVSNTAFGTLGPKGKDLGFDSVAQAMSGAMYMTGPAEEPTKAFVPYCDYFSASMATVGTLTALMNRNIHGRGQRVETSLLQSGIFLNSATITEQSLLQNNRKATNNRSEAFAPGDCYKTADGHIMVMSLGNKQFLKLADLIDKPEWKQDPRFLTDYSRGLHSEYISEILQQWCLDKTNEEITTLFRTATVPLGPVLTPQEVLEDEHINAMGALRNYQMTDSNRTFPLSALPVTLSENAAQDRRAPARLGQHSSEFLAELGFDATSIKVMLDNNDIHQFSD